MKKQLEEEEKKQQYNQQTDQHVFAKKMKSNRSIVVIGQAGKGKSSILNTLIAGNPHAQHIFKAEDSADAVTLKIQRKDSKIYGTSC